VLRWLAGKVQKILAVAPVAGGEVRTPAPAKASMEAM